jgi:hypothetical protein
MIKVIIHSSVDLITNSSTVIFTYQDSIEQAKELVNEVLKLSNITDKTADDIFWYALFYEDNYTYLNDKSFYNHFKDELDHLDYQKRSKWIDQLKLSIVKGEIQKPECMKNIGNYSLDMDNSYCLYLVPKDNKYKELAYKIENLLGSVSADGGREG